MDVVPSPGLINQTFAASPHFSIYDHDKTERWANQCNLSATMTHQAQDAYITDDMSCTLDDKLEDSTLQTFFQMGGKSNLVNGVHTTTSNTLGTATPTLAELNMDPEDLSIVNDLLELDSGENSTLELINMCNNIDPKLANSIVPDAGNSPQPLSYSQKSADSKVNANNPLKNTDPTFGHSVRNFSPFSNNFPPRLSQPIVGVVNPVIKKEDIIVKPPVLKDLDVDEKLQAQAPFLHKLLKSQPDSMKSEVPSGSKPIDKSQIPVITRADLPAQIVPSVRTTKRKSTGSIKDEPSSPQKAVPFHSEESIEEKWKDIENFIHNPEEEPEMKKRKRYDSGGSGHTSDDYDYDDKTFVDENVDDSDDDYSDIDEDITHMKPSECESLVATGKKQKQYFWQYNIQSKGPKGTRLKLAIESPSDPHVLNDFEDPVFDEGNTAVAGIRHGGKARKGDGNEITPSPKKLFMIGHQLLRLNHQINACQLGPDVPAPRRNEARKEKNKLASRACRLKKKAQHEANKIKLHGLEEEHSQLNDVIKYIWPILREKAKAQLSGHQGTSPLSPSESLTRTLEARCSQSLNSAVAGKTVDYVNGVILSVEAGDRTGGLDIRRSHKT